jgi:hypothetical protein
VGPPPSHIAKTAGNNNRIPLLIHCSPRRLSSSSRRRK